MPPSSGKTSPGDEEAARIHLDGARDCLAFSEQVVATMSGTHCGWAVTGLFYSAVHLVRAYLRTKGCVISAHQDMRSKYDEYPELRRVKPSYEHLKQQSEQARYYVVPFAASDVAKLRKSVETIANIVIPWLTDGLREYYKRPPG